VKKNSPQSESSEQKVMPILRRTLSELGIVAVETESDAHRWIGGGWKKQN
jgi:hypothetical protein